MALNTFFEHVGLIGDLAMVAMITFFEHSGLIGGLTMAVMIAALRQPT